MKFQDKEHQERYEAMTARARMYPGDKERMALFFILSGDLMHHKAEGLYDFKENGIKEIPGVLSTAEKRLAELGFNLYNRYGEATPSDLFSSLDRKNLELALEAIRIRFL